MKKVMKVTQPSSFPMDIRRKQIPYIYGKEARREWILRALTRGRENLISTLEGQTRALKICKENGRSTRKEIQEREFGIDAIQAALEDLDNTLKAFKSDKKKGEVKIVSLFKHQGDRANIFGNEGFCNLFIRGHEVVKKWFRKRNIPCPRYLLATIGD